MKLIQNSFSVFSSHFSEQQNADALKNSPEHIANIPQPSEMKTKQKRFVSNQESLLAQQLHGLKKNIKA